MDKFEKEYTTDFGYLAGYETFYQKGGHPFMIGTAHVAYASDHCGGMLGEEACRSHVCYDCKEPYDSPRHHGEKAACVMLTRDCTEKELSGWLSGIKEEMEELKIDGFAFVNAKEYHVYRGEEMIL